MSPLYGLIAIFFSHHSRCHQLLLHHPHRSTRAIQLQTNTFALRLLIIAIFFLAIILAYAWQISVIQATKHTQDRDKDGKKESK